MSGVSAHTYLTITWIGKAPPIAFHPFGNKSRGGPGKLSVRTARRITLLRRGGTSVAGFPTVGIRQYRRSAHALE